MKMPRRGDNIFKRKDGLWEARYLKEIDVYGKKKYGSVYSRSYAEVKQKRQDALDYILLNQKPISYRDITINELIDEWLYINKARLKLSTFQRYCGYSKNHIKDNIGNLRVLYATPVAIQNFSALLLKKGLSAQTINSVLIFLHSVIKYGHNQHHLPLPEFQYFRVEPKEMRVLSRNEQQRLLEYLKKDMDIYKFGVLLALYTGIRVGELCALRWEDVEDGCIYIRQTVQRLQSNDRKGTELIISAPKTKKSLRAIPLLSALDKYIEHFQKDNEKREYVLGTPNHSITEPRVMQYKFKKYMNDLNIDDATMHTLRHTFATRAIEAGVDVKSLSELLGHSGVQISLNRYVHSSLSHKKYNVEKLSAFF